MRNLLVTDMHGAFKALMQVLDRSGFDPDVDNLICLGDTADGWPEIRECFEYLMSLDNLVYCKGNHDEWFLKHLTDEFDSFDECLLWQQQGGMATIKSICGHPTDDILKFIDDGKLYHTIDDKLFCHAGVPLNAHKDTLDLIPRQTYIWDRLLVEEARLGSISTDPVVPNFSMVFVGHTPTLCYGFDTPKQYNNVMLCDTGASYDGKLSIIDTNTLEYWQSDTVPSLYPNHKGR